MAKGRDLEKELEKIRRLADNKSCPNCASEDKMGYRNVCVKFTTLVCGNCKAAHQAFSHRMKGLGMSTFEPTEVDALARTSNARQAAVWLGKLTREQVCAMAPTSAAPPQEWHEWIGRIYEKKEFYVEGGAPTQAPAPRAPAAAAPASAPAHVATPAPAVNFLGDFSAPAAAPASAFDDGFGAFAAAPAAASGFGAFAAAPAARPAAAAPAAAFDDGFGAFSSAPAAAPVQPAAQDPFSMMDSLAAPPPQKKIDLDSLYQQPGPGFGGPPPGGRPGMMMGGGGGMPPRMGPGAGMPGMPPQMGGMQMPQMGMPGPMMSGMMMMGGGMQPGMGGIQHQPPQFMTGGPGAGMQGGPGLMMGGGPFGGGPLGQMGGPLGGMGGPRPGGAPGGAGAPFQF